MNGIISVIYLVTILTAVLLPRLLGGIVKKKHTKRRLIVAITGASGGLYAVRVLKAALEADVDVDLVVPDYGKRLLIEECELNLKSTPLGDWLDQRYGPAERGGEIVEYSVPDLGSPLASGTRHWDGMVVVPCTMKTLAGIAAGSSSNLIETSGRESCTSPAGLA